MKYFVLKNKNIIFAIIILFIVYEFIYSLQPKYDFNINGSVIYRMNRISGQVEKIEPCNLYNPHWKEVK